MSRAQALLAALSAILAPHRAMEISPNPWWVIGVTSIAVGACIFVYLATQYRDWKDSL
jgi:hypothetical protein